MKMKTVLAILLLLIYVKLQAQKQNEFIVYNNGDTSWVDVTKASNKKKVVCLNENNMKFEFKITQVQAYKFEENIYHRVDFITAGGDVKQLFLTPVINGYLSMYLYDSGGNTGAGAGGGVYVPPSYILKRKGEKGKVIMTGNQALIRDYFSDFPEVQQKPKEKDFSMDDLSATVEAYNKWYAEKSK
jgi:hypothetical protein